MNISELLDILLNFDLLINSKSKTSADYPNEKFVSTLQFFAIVFAGILFYIESNYIFSLENFILNFVIFFSISFLFSVLLLIILNHFQFIHSIQFSDVLWFIISFSLFSTSLLNAINYISSECFFALKEI